MIRSLICAVAFAAAPTLAFAVDAPATTLFPGALDMPIFDGASVPDDCHFPASLQDPARFELACVVMPMDSEEVSMNFIGWLGQHQFRRDQEIIGGMSAVRPAENGCEQVLDIYTREYPPEAETHENMVIWFALEREPRCAAPHG